MTNDNIYLTVTFNSVPLFFPLSIDKLITCQKHNEDRSELQEWLKIKKVGGIYLLSCSLERQ